MATPSPRSPYAAGVAESARAEELLGVVRSLYTELHRAEPDLQSVTLQSALDRDLGFDSLARVELLLRIEQQLGVHLSEDTLATAETVADLLREATSPGALSGGGVRSLAPATVAALAPRPRLSEPIDATTLLQVLESRVQTSPAATHAVVLGEGPPETLGYAQLQDGARIVAGALARAGVPGGATVALMLPTSSAYLYCFLGVLLAGAIPVPIYPPTRPSQLEEHIQRHAGILANAAADALITFREARAAGRLLQARVPTLRRVLSVAELLEGEPLDTIPTVPTADSIAMLQYTSGSTGAPKGVVLTHANLLANIRTMGRAVRASDSDVFVSWLPLYHDMGLIGAWLGCLYYGCVFVVMPPTSFLTRPVRWLRAIHDYRATLSASPNFGYELCARRLSDEELQGLDLSSWRIAFNGAEPVSADTLERFNRRLAPCGFRPAAMTPVYGLAEAAVGVTFPPLGRGPNTDCIDRNEMMATGRALPVAADHPQALHFVSCGRPLPGYELRLVDESGAEAPERMEGTVEFRGPSATSGYYRNPGATDRLHHGRWLDTGDRGYMAAGELYVTGRVKDIIIRRGQHIYPDEVERAVGELEGVRRGCVVAFGSREPATATEKLVVLAETRYKDPAARAQLSARINQRVVDNLGEPPEEILLAPPHTVLKTSSGKLRRAATRAAYEDGSLGRAHASPALQLLRLTLQGVRPELQRMARSGARIAYGVYADLAILVFFAAFGLPGLLLRDRRRLWRLNHRATGWLIRALRIPFSVLWEADVDLSAPHIIVANHCSYVDSVIIGAVLPEAHLFIAKTELQRVPVLATWLRRIGTVFIKRFEPAQSVAEVGRLEQELAKGNSLVMFPEGTFTRETGLKPFHLGAFRVAAAAGVPVIPLTLRGTRSVLRDGQWLLRRLPVSAVVGPPLAPAPAADRFAAAVRLRDMAREQIRARCGEPDLT
ncbi:MAG TPA: AMP-binding protein [Steroidobacteraceae bacterium]|nr:AMP-binding protein [Steroidobacteraceae bacterium]